MTEVAARQGLERITSRRTRIGLVAGGLGAYWPQFPDLLPQLQASARRVADLAVVAGLLHLDLTVVAP